MIKLSVSLPFFLMTVSGLSPAFAGLDLQNQKEINLSAMDLDHDGRLTREEAGRYMFYYFDHDGNESLSAGEYDARRPLTVLPYDAAAFTNVDLDNDGQDDATVYTTETFLQKVMVGQPGDGEGIEASEFMDMGFLRLDIDKSKYIERPEWEKQYQKSFVLKPNLPPKASDQDRYRR